eukprot:6194289-Pleurochrysis_carterae.AAC.1
MFYVVNAFWGSKQPIARRQSLLSKRVDAPARRWPLLRTSVCASWPTLSTTCALPCAAARCHLFSFTRSLFPCPSCPMADLLFTFATIDEALAIASESASARSRVRTRALLSDTHTHTHTHKEGGRETQTVHRHRHRQRQKHSHIFQAQRCACQPILT